MCLRSVASATLTSRSCGLKNGFPKLIRGSSTWAQDACHPSNSVQCYTSTSNDPFLNLSIEHYLLEKSPPQSKVLFLYINRPCVVIGRNQNPWLEVNLAALTKPTNPFGNVDLVRRRSGGGAVFHDRGNVNWTVICPADTFTRDKHAEMIVGALRSSGIERARVNERHDIVLDQGFNHRGADPKDLHKTAYTSHDPAMRPLKVSGSAYKLTKGRALHHGTCLLTSPNLRNISQLLHSPARPYIKAKGVESVSSPVTNIGLDTSVFEGLVRKEFRKLYDVKGLETVQVGEDALNVPAILRGHTELLVSVAHLSTWLQLTRKFDHGMVMGSDTFLLRHEPS